MSESATNQCDPEQDSELSSNTVHKSRQVPLIAHVIYRLDVGGLENGVVNLINRMPKDRFQHAIICITNYSNYRYRLTRKVSLFALHKREGKDFGLYLRLWRLFRKLRPAIVHTRNLAALEAQFPAMLAGVHCRIHGEHGRDIQDMHGTIWKYRALRILFRPLIDKYIPLSRELETYLRVSIGVPEEKIFPICNGVDGARFYPANGKNNVFPAGFKCPNCIVFGTIGRMEAVKDQMTLACAFIKLVSHLAKERWRLRLVMVGEGSLRQEVIAVLEAAQLSDLVWLPGARDDVPELLRSMDVFVLPSLAEGISNTILEAMASGLPVIATDVGGNSELVIQGETGYLVSPHNPESMAKAMQRYVTDAGLGEYHGARARAIINSRFQLDHMVSRYCTIYEELLNLNG